MVNKVAPVLSILIPTYDKPEGLSKIFNSLAALIGRLDVEIIISDDSRDDLLAREIQAISEKFPASLYRRNRPSLGAIKNWNQLLSQAKGKYLWLLHHDEEPSEDLDLTEMVDRLSKNADADIWLLACRVVRLGARSQAGDAQPLHFPPTWAVAILRRWPAYVLRRNIIGPPSALIIKRQHYVSFNEQLKWRVDVETYYRILKQVQSIQVWPHGHLRSHLDSVNSITASLAGRIHEIEEQERIVLQQLHGTRREVSFWISNSPVPRVIRAFEFLAWIIFRSAFRLSQIAVSWRSGIFR